MWAAHQTHHSSEEYTLTSALRQSALQKYFSWVRSANVVHSAVNRLLESYVLAGNVVIFNIIDEQLQ